jgi:hypothetical protein
LCILMSRLFVLFNIYLYLALELTCNISSINKNQNSALGFNQAENSLNLSISSRDSNMR